MNDQPADTSDLASRYKPGPKGSGGWLLIPAIGLPLSLLKGAAELGFMTEGFDSEWTSDPNLWAVAIIDAVMIVAGGLLVALFFSKARFTVLLFIAFLIAQVLVAIVQLLLVSASDVDYAVSFKPLLGSVVVAAIWVPYFATSERVKNTFIED